VLLPVLMLFIIAASGCSMINKIEGTVSGTVYMNNRPMPGFKVSLVSKTTGKVIATEPTNQQGHYIISDVPPGEYTVLVLNFSGAPHPGYEGNIKVRPGRTEICDPDLGGGAVPEPKPR
jgi:hypothetical protein